MRLTCPPALGLGGLGQFSFEGSWCEFRNGQTTPPDAAGVVRRLPFHLVPGDHVYALRGALRRISQYRAHAALVLFVRHIRGQSAFHANAHRGLPPGDKLIDTMRGRE